MTDTATFACPSCAAAAAPGDHFCEACGHSLGLGRAEPAAPPTVARTGCPACGPDAPVTVGYCDLCGIKQRAPRDHVEAVHPDVAAVTDRGRRRRHNEDAFALSREADGHVVAAICDGVSSTASSAEASEQAADAAVATLVQSRNGGRVDDNLQDAFVAARDAVRQVTWSPDEGLGPPSCTFLAASAAGSHLELSSVGDCRAFWLPEEGDPQTLTEDDSWATERIRAGAMTEDEAYADPSASTITRWIGMDADPSWRPRRLEFGTSGPGRLVLCSDGLWRYAGSADHISAEAGRGDALTVARRLVDYANRQGGHDNITVVVVDMPRPSPGPGKPS